MNDRINDVFFLKPTKSIAMLAGVVSVCLFLNGCSTTSKDLQDASTPPEKLYLEAKGEMSDGNYETAIKFLEKLEGRATGTQLAQQAELDLAYCFYKNGDKARALAKIDRFIRLHPANSAFDYALYLQGLINFNDNLGLLGEFTRQDFSERDQQAARDAYESFRQLTDRFPDSPYATDSRARMNYILNSLAKYEIHVARYYYRRGGYLAAANRAQKAVQEFRTSPYIEEALYIMVLSYDKLKLDALRDDANRVLTFNYPHSKYLQQGYRMDEKPWWQLW